MNDTLELVYVVRRRNSHWTYMSVVSYIVCYSPILSVTVLYCLLQSYLESFYDFCQELGGATADVMCEALAVSCPFQERLTTKVLITGFWCRAQNNTVPVSWWWTFNTGRRTKRQRNTFCVMCLMWTNRWLSGCYKLQSESYSGMFWDSVIMMVFKLFSSHAVHGNK